MFRRKKKQKKKQLIIFLPDGQVLFQGNPLDMPIIESKMKEKSLELFNDPNPCIIHQSYVMNVFADTIKTKLTNKDILHLNKHPDLNFLNVPSEAIIKWSDEG